MRRFLARVVIVSACALAAAHAGAAESGSYIAYSEGKYLTALDLAQKEAEAGSM